MNSATFIIQEQAMKFTALLVLLVFSLRVVPQKFTRSELPTQLSTPWEIVYGPDNHLWITEKDGVVSRVDPLTGVKFTVHVAQDYYAGHASESNTLCPGVKIGSGTLGMALHPDFLYGQPYLYYVYSYNAGNSATPKTKFKIERLTLNPEYNTVTSSLTLASYLPSGFDHLGGRLHIICLSR
jgi:aldose sugar dehydrogenase